MNINFWNLYTEQIRTALDSSLANYLGDSVTIDAALEIACNWSEKCSEMFFVGNGASAAMASHMSADWSKLGGVRSSCFTDPALITATANDFSYQDVFQIHVEKWAKPDDILVLVSSSGRSENVIRAAGAAHRKNAKVIAFTGFEPGNLSRSSADLAFYVPSSSYGIVECVHQILLHAWLDAYVGAAASSG